jgi:hypothetical protein
MAQLQHDPELVARLAIAHEGSAAVHFEHARSRRLREENIREHWSQHEMLAASSLVIAASLWSMIDPHRAVSIYRKAARFYRAIGHAYWMVLALASGARDEIFETANVVEETPISNPQTIAFAMVANEVRDDRRHGAQSERLDAEWRHAGNIPVGRLGIPLDHYGRCAQAMRQARTRKNVERFVRDASTYIHRAAEVLRTASHDRFHWKQLRSSILPAEPEAIAMTAAMSMMSHDVFGMPLIELREMPDLDAHGRLLVDIGQEMRDAAATDRDNPM